MDLLAEIAKEKLVIMVTHNPELAEKYATRTIRLLTAGWWTTPLPATARRSSRCRRKQERKSPP